MGEDRDLPDVGAPEGPRPAPRWRRVAAFGVIAIVLAAVFAAYLNPHLAVDLASRFWACF